MQSSQLRRLLYYKAFGYRYVGAEILSGGARFFKALDALKSATAECNLCELAKTRTSSSEQNFSGQGSTGAVNLKDSAQQGANGGEKQDVNNIANQGKKKAAAQNIQNAQSVQNTQNVETEALENLRALALDDEILPIGGAALFNDACKILRRNALQDLMQKLKNSDAPDKIERILEYQKKINQLK